MTAPANGDVLVPAKEDVKVVEIPVREVSKVSVEMVAMVHLGNDGGYYNEEQCRHS